MDFDDLLVYTYILFRDFPDVLARYRDQFRYVLQDNAVLRIVRILIRKSSSWNRIIVLRKRSSVLPTV